MAKFIVDAEFAYRLAQIALGHVTQEYPNKLDHVMTDPADTQTPRQLHPVFYGSFDWHSCVHSYWLLARLRRSFPALPQRLQIDSLFDSHLTKEQLSGECGYLERPHTGTFERPYGWAWLLMLAEELRSAGDESSRWAHALAPLARVFARRMRDYLPKLTYPIRAGTHFNSAFALALAFQYASGHGDGALADLVRARALDWFEADAACQAWEPSGDDFLSPALMEAECMRRVMDREAFFGWFNRFLPEIAAEQPRTLFTPARVSDRADGKIAHLDGLNLSRAWCWRSIASHYPPAHPLRACALAAAQRHLAASLPYLAVDYMGAHWLASFALLALSPETSTTHST